MRFRTLIARGLRFHWRAHLGVALGATVATAVLVGALAVGDSVRTTLRWGALARLGATEAALASGDRFFTVGLADNLAAGLDAAAAPVLQLRGTVARQDGAARAGGVQVLGVDDRFWAMAGARPPWPSHSADASAAVNRRLARQLGVGPGDEVLVRVAKPSSLPLDAPFAGETDPALAFRLKVAAVVPDDSLGRFSLQASQVAPCNLFVPAAWLDVQVDREGQANVLLVGPREGRAPAAASTHSPLTARADAALAQAWTIQDAELDLLPRPDRGALDLCTPRVFLDPAVAPAAAVEPGAMGILTYFVNELRAGDRATPYSMVSAVGPLARGEAQRRANGDPRLTPGASNGASRAPSTLSPRPSPLDVLPAGMADDECVINAWLAEDLAAKPGDSLDMTYYVMGPASRLETRSARFRIRAVVPLEGAAADRTLMPDFPGLADVENCRDWKPGAPVDLKKIRKKDEAYWNQYRGTPKAFITLAAGQKMWANRFGGLTAVRFPAAGGDSAESLGERLRSRLNPRDFGLYFLPVRERALAAAESATDFGGLFLGLSFFLVAAALVLTGLLFALQVEQRTEETGTLLALGLPQRQVRRLYLAEGAGVALLGAALGSAAGLLYTRVVLWGLATVWQGAVGAADIRFHAEPLSVAGGTAAGFLVALAAIRLAVRRQARAPARELLAAGAEAEWRPAGSARTGPLPGLLVAAAGGAAAGLILPLARSATGEQAAGVFFGVGALALVAGLGLCHALLARLARVPRHFDTLTQPTQGGTAGLSGRGVVRGTRPDKPAVPPPLGESPMTYPVRARRARLNLAGLALRNAARRRGRSLATVALLACGVFLVIAVDLFHLGPGGDATQRAGGTGGFALYGETSLPVVEDLNTAEGRRALALPVEKGTAPFSGLSEKGAVPFSAEEHAVPNAERGTVPFSQQREKGTAPLSASAPPTFRVMALRVHEGDDASCLNLNRPQQPRIVGVRPEELAARGAFSFAETLGGQAAQNPWLLLAPRPDDGAVPAIADQTTITWALKMKVGDTIDYTDERGRPFKVRLVAALANSILQGSLLVSEDSLVEKFPSGSGRRMFLIDAPPERAGEAAAVLSRQMSDVGMAVTSAADRLAAFGAVQNTYLAIFQALGGLGLVLGSIGLGIVVLRNVLERRGELAVLRAVGFPRRSLDRLVLREHWLLLALGLAVGTVAAAVAVLPALRSSGAEVPYVSLAATLAAVFASGLVWTWLAARLAMRGPLLGALRNE
jgi:ABC-type antimicrobial peptide transport system permease subunit